VQRYLLPHSNCACAVFGLQEWFIKRLKVNALGFFVFVVRNRERLNVIPAIKLAFREQAMLNL